MAKTTKKTVSLVLGSGGARGLAHIGVIHWLEENNYKIGSIVGCSMGALVGGIYAAGKLDEFEQWVCAITKVDIVTLLDIAWQKSGLVKGDKIIHTLTNLVGARLIEDLPIPYTAVATDIKGQKEVWINSGNLFDAIRSAISIPLIFTPFKYNGVDLIDGGILNPVPIAPTFGDETDMTIAVNLNGPVESPDKRDASGSAPVPYSSPFQKKINQFINRLVPASAINSDKDWGMYDITLQAFESMQTTIARQKLAAYPPDVLIEIPRNTCRMLEFDRASEMIELGYRKAGESVSQAPKSQ
ncbi:MAG: patatin-like phospholipase family protein [Deltaproteobacteria bacterium]|nr:patatin-like phospholipase family protein [Deltaproteobacteria bacterium]